MNNQEIAVKNFETMNCNQSVLATYGSQFGISNELSFTLGLSFGGGMGKQGKTCGAVTGAYIVIGLWSAKQTNDLQEQKNIAALKVQEFNKLFVKDFASIECKSLLEYDMTIKEEAEKINELGLFDTVCPKLVAASTKILDKILL